MGCWLLGCFLWSRWCYHTSQNVEKQRSESYAPDAPSPSHCFHVSVLPIGCMPRSVLCHRKLPFPLHILGSSVSRRPMCTFQGSNAIFPVSPFLPEQEPHCSPPAPPFLEVWPITLQPASVCHGEGAFWRASSGFQSGRCAVPPCTWWLCGPGARFSTRVARSGVPVDMGGLGGPESLFTGSH